jgi:hypothetical protein
MGKVMFLKNGEVHTAPKKPGLELSTLAEGSIVKLNENGSPVEFYVAKHNYESALNGAGRTLLVRKDCYDIRAWDEDRAEYIDSDIDIWLNNTYLTLLGSIVKSIIPSTAFYVTSGNGSTIVTYERQMFLLSMYELGYSQRGVNENEGSTLSVANILKTTSNGQWTRSADRMVSYGAFDIKSDGTMRAASIGVTSGSRPCFTLPSTAVFDTETFIFKEVG